MRTTRKFDDFFEELSDHVFQHGLASFTMAQLCQQLSCSKRRLYEVADTRQALFERVVSAFFEKILVQSDALLDKRSDDLVAQIKEYMSIGVKAGHGLSKTFFAELESDPITKNLFDEYQQKRIEGVKQLIQRGQQAGIFRNLNADVIAVALIRAATVIRTAAFLQTVDIDMEQAFDELYQLILYGVVIDADVL